ncbi:Uncharacterized protein TCM_002766 [Theobroma cacao]|uniref:RNase H type-1 domain-containing protein n=1 Tax=Theobroma cacao TaxID=3641 RepID=A0A061DN20_THECC|nr:Uncharacterized protein TCM_002766 [Theobroma cacao]
MAQVCYFFNNDEWDVDKLNSVLPEEMVAEILKIPLNTSSTNMAYWVSTSDGDFTIKSAWEIIWQKDLFKRWQWRGDLQIAQAWGLMFQRASPPSPKIFSWHKPLTGEFKLNVDDSSKHNCQNAAGSGLLRDHTGIVIFGFSKNFRLYISLQAELMALHRGLLLCIEYNVSRIWIEMNAKVVVQMIHEGNKGSSQTRYLLASIRKCLNAISYCISHIHREGNQVVDHLSNQGHSDKNLHVLS